MLDTYKKRILEHKLNVYFICEADKKYQIKKEEICPANPTCNCYSVAKAFVVLAIGILYDKGLITLNTLLLNVLHKYLPKKMDDKWKKVTIHDLLSHKVGFGSGLLDIDVDDASKYPTFNYLDIIFNTKLKYEPGTIYQYSDASYYLLSRVVCEVSGLDLEDLLRPILMKSMKFKELAWSKCPNGYTIGATGLYLRTEDMVKLGILFLNQGTYENERIVSKEWIDLVIEKGYEFTYLNNGWYVKGGMRGQLLMFNFLKEKVVACHSYEKNLSLNIFVD